jgi:hypothetical protein
VTYVSDPRQKWRLEAPFGEDRPDRVLVLVPPGLWSAEGRPMADIVAEFAEERCDRIDRYVEGAEAG